MDKLVKLVGERCSLAPCHSNDAEKWATWFNDLDVTLPLGDEAYSPCGLERMQEDVARTIREGDHVFSIVDNASQEVIGRCLLFNFDWVNRSAMFGIVIGEKAFWGQGYGQDATRLLLDYAFTLLNLNSIMLGVYAFNQRAIHCYENVGFKLIGRRREARIVGNQKFDAFFMDMLASEFTESRIARQLTVQSK